MYIISQLSLLRTNQGKLVIKNLHVNETVAQLHKYNINYKIYFLLLASKKCKTIYLCTFCNSIAIIDGYKYGDTVCI